MTRRFGEGEGLTKWLKEVAERRSVHAPRADLRLQPDADVMLDEVDPTDFFDPEQFGIRQRDFRPKP
jgi:hypothetical protein